MTSPAKAAEIIVGGVERGKARILVGPDSYLFDALARIAPVHYYSVVAMLEARLRARLGKTAPAVSDHNAGPGDTVTLDGTAGPGEAR